MSLNQVAHLQTEIAHAYMRRHHLSPSEFVDINRKYDILRFLELGYESFHLTGTQGVVDEVEQFVAEQQTSHHQARVTEREIARNMIADGESVEKIVRYTGLSREEVEKLGV